MYIKKYERYPKLIFVNETDRSQFTDVISRLRTFLNDSLDKQYLLRFRIILQ